MRNSGKECGKRDFITTGFGRTADKPLSAKPADRRVIRILGGGAAIYLMSGQNVRLCRGNDDMFSVE